MSHSPSDDAAPDATPSPQLGHADARSTTRSAERIAGGEVSAGLASELADMARELEAATSTDDLLRRIAEAAVQEVDAAHWAGISEITPTRVQTRAATGRLVEQIDEMQMRVGEGPCLTSLRDQITVRTEDLATEQRWPEFARTAAGAGIRSMLSVQLFVSRENMGALNMYSTEPHAFSDDDETAGILLAAHAAVAMKADRLEGNLHRALASRDLIGQAKGILIERHKITPDAAFHLLVQASNAAHRKLRDVAEEIVSTGQVPQR